MKFVAHIMAASAIAMAAPAEAADWWLVSGSPRDQAALFADTDTLVRQGGGASLRVLRIDRAGRSDEAIEHVRCSGRVDSKGEEAVRRFACAADADRDQFGLILAAMSPAEVARMIFGTGASPLDDGDPSRGPLSS